MTHRNHAVQPIELSREQRFALLRAERGEVSPDWTPVEVELNRAARELRGARSALSMSEEWMAAKFDEAADRGVPPERIAFLCAELPEEHRLEDELDLLEHAARRLVDSDGAIP